MNARNAVVSGLIGISVVAFTVVALVLYAFRPKSGAPTERPTSVSVLGVGADAPLALRFDGSPIVADPGVPADLGVVRIGRRVEIAWFYGDGCIDGCPDRCPAWCLTGTHDFEVPAGEDRFVATLDIVPPTPRPVVLDLAAEPSRAELDGVPGVLSATRAAFEPVPPGSYEALVEIGTCPEAALGCTSTGDPCPTECVSWIQQVVVPVGAGELRLDVALPTGSEPKPAPVAPVQPRSTGAVSGAAFARFVQAQPKWAKETAIAEGRADARYLKDWNPGPPPGPVTRVTWNAARAFCANRGGLAALDAAPTTWARGSGPTQEWRDASGQPAWRRFDGETSTRAQADRAFSFTGFRCAN